MSNTTENKSIWVFKHDGTIQCDNSIQPIPSKTHRAQLIKLIGEENIISEGAISSIPVPTMCGLPKGGINAFESTSQGAYILFNGFVGPMGFEVLDEQNAITIGDLLLANKQTPSLIAELVGRPLRAYQKGDLLTEDYRPERVNIETNEDGEIIQIWFG